MAHRRRSSSPATPRPTIAARILGGGKASRLYKSLVYDKKIAQDVTPTQQSLALGSVFQITATAKPGHTAEELEAAIEAELDALAAEGPTADELAAAQERASTRRHRRRASRTWAASAASPTGCNSTTTTRATPAT